MIDVLLVLLVIFMLVAPLSTTGLPALVPQPPPAQDVPARPRDIVITLAADGTVHLNQEMLTIESLPARLAWIFAGAPA